MKGDAINLAARVMAKAAAGPAARDQPTLAASPTEFDTEPLPPFLVKGKSQPVARRQRRTGPVARAGRPTDLLPLLGREVEVAALTDALDRAAARQGSVVELVGEPGIGKSRLADEARALALTGASSSCQPPAGSTSRRRRTSRSGSSCSRSSASLPTRSPDVVLRRLVDRVAINQPDLLPWLPLLGVPLDLELPGTPETSAIEERFRAGRVREVTVRFLDAVLPTATLLVIEDAQLMDEASAEVFTARARPGSRHGPGCCW